MIKPLTSLRFVFAFLVFMSHMNLFPHEEPGFLWHLFYEGYAGVSFFFMLSGFILAYTYQQRLIDGTATVRSFYVARIARIYPLHLLALFVALFFLKFFNHPSPTDFFDLGINTFLLQSFIPGQEFLFNSVSWSLSDEAFFYALFPLIVFSTFSRPTPGDHTLLECAGVCHCRLGLSAAQPPMGQLGALHQSALPHLRFSAGHRTL